MAVNFVSYLSNIGKSITYAAVDKVKEMNPAIEEFMSTNGELSKELYAAVKDYKGTINRTKERVIKSDLYEAADVGFHAIIEDIRTGKFYNKERIDEMETRAGGSMTNYDDMGDPFAELDKTDENGDFNWDDDEPDISDDTEVIVDSVDHIGSKVTSGIAEATVRTGEMISQTNVEIAAKGQKHDTFLANKLSAGMGAINGTIAEVIKFNTDIQKPFIDRSIEFYNDIANQHKETNDLLKQIIDNQNKAIAPIMERKTDKEVIDWNTLGEIPDFKEYAKLIKKNIKDQSMGIFDMFDKSSTGMGNLMLSFVASPLQKIPEAIVKYMVPKTMETVMKSLNDTMTGAFGATLARLNRMAEDEDGNIISKTLGKVFGLSKASSIKNTVDINGISERAIAWDEQSKQALVRVIPDTLAKILAAETNTAEQLYDYNTGKYVDMKSLADQYDPSKVTYDAAYASLRDMMGPIEKALSGYKISNENTLEGLKEAMKSMVVNMYRNDRVLTPEYAKYLLENPGEGNEQKLQEIIGSYDTQSVNILASVIANLQDNQDFKAAVKNANASIFSQKASQRRKFEDMSTHSGAVVNNLYNGYDPNNSIIKDSSGKFITNKKGKLTDQQIEMQSLDVFDHLGYSSLAYQKETINVLYNIKDTIGSFYGYIQSTNPYDERLAIKARKDMYHNAGLKTEEEEFIDAFKNRTDLADEEKVVVNNMIEALEAKDQLPTYTNKYTQLFEEKTRSNIEAIQELYSKRFEEWIDKLENLDYIYGEGNYEDPGMDMTDITTTTTLPTLERRVNEYKTRDEKYRELIEKINNGEISSITNTPSIDNSNNRIVTTGGPIVTANSSTSVSSFFNTINKRRDKSIDQNAKAEEKNTTKELEAHNKRAEEYEKKGLHASNLDEDVLSRMYDNMDGADTNRTEGQNIYNAMTGQMQGDASYRKFINDVKEQKEKDEKLSFNRLMNELFKTDKDGEDTDSKTKTFLQGLKELSEKPSEFMVRMIKKVDDRLYTVVFGDPTSDQLSPKSFMSQLTTRLGYIFRDFRGFLTDEVFGPIKETLFGDEGALSTASKKVKEIFDWDKLKTSDSVADFILGEKDENGKRHGGMFGDKFNFAKDSMKNVYGTLGDLLVETPDGNLSIDMQKFNRTRDEYYDQDKNADGSLSGYKVSEIQELLFNTDEGKVIGNDELSKKYHDLALAKGIISKDKDFSEDEDYKRIAKEYRNIYGNTIEEIDLNNLILKAFVTYKLGEMGYQSAANVLQDIKSNFEEQEKFMKDKAYRKFQLSQMFDMDTDELTNFMNNRESLDKRIANGEFEDPWSVQDEEERLGLRDDRWFSAGSEGQKALEQYMKDVQAARVRQKYMKDTYNNDLFIKSGILGKTDKLVYKDEFKDSHIDKTLLHNNIPGMKEYMERYGSKDTGKYDYENDEEIGQFAKGGVVTKTGVIAASEGEMIIPSKYNPNYHGDTNTESNLKKESNAIDKFLQSIGIKDFKIPQYAEGGTVGDDDGTGEVKPLDMPDINDEQFRYGHGKQFIINTREKYLNRVTERRKNKYRARNYNKLSDKQKQFIDSIGYDSDEYNNLSEAEKILFEEGKFQELIEKISASGNRIAEGLDIVADDVNGEEDYTTQKEKLFGSMMEDLKENVGKYLPSSLGSALIGGGISLVTGAVGGPLVGAAVGAAADLTVHSKSVQDWLFGEEFIDADGNTKRKGNVLSKDLSNFITQYLPDMAKGGTVGAITSILPFVPGGPVAGLFIGAGLGFAKNNETIMSKLFGTLGEDGKRNDDGLLPPDFTDTLKKLLPEAAIGAIGGAAGGALLGGPFGLVGNMTIGAGISVLSQTDKFQDALFGTKDPSTGIRQGGLVGAIKTGFVDPLVETGTSLKDKFIDWFKNDIANPISKAIAPLAKQGGLFAGGIIKGVTSGINTIMQKELGTSFSGLGYLLHDITKNVMTAGLGAINMSTRPIGKMISSPFRTIGRIGEHYRKRHVADGNADYMTALQRLQYRQELNDNVEYKKYDSDVVDERTGEILHRKGDVMTDGMGRPIKNKDRGFKYFHNTLRRGKMNKFFGHTDKFEEFDKTLVDMDKDELASLRNSLEYLKNPNQGSTLLRNEAVSKINDTVHTKYGFSHGQSQKLLNILKDKGLEAARRYISNLGMSETDERELMNVLTQNYSVYEASNEINSRSGVLRRNLMSNLRDMGLKGMTEGNIDKHLNYVKQELKLKEDQNPIDKLNEKQEERHRQIINLFESAVDQLKILNGTESTASIAKKYAKRNKAFAETKSTMMGLTEKIIGRTGANEQFNIANSNAIWGANYEMDNEVSKDGKHIKWFMVNKQDPSIRIEVDSNGNPVNSEDMSLVPDLNYRRNGLIRSGLGKAKNKVKTVASNAWNLGMAERRTRRNTKFDSKMEDQFREEYEKLYNKYKDYIDLPTIEDKGENESWREFYERVLNLLKSEGFDNEKMMNKDKKLHNKFFKNYLHRRGIHTSKARFGKYTDENGSKIGLKEQYEHARGLEDQYGLDGQGKIVGEEQDELGKRMTVSDLFGNPIQLIKSRDGRWIKNPSDSENKQASWLHDKLLGLGDKVGGVLSNIGTDIKDGFNHLFNIDTEKDGWLKTLLKVGTGILGTMTAVSAMPAMEAWWTDSIKPAIGEFWQAKVLPKISGVMEPIKPYIARAAIGIDMAIRSIPDSIGVLGDRIKSFITEDLPQIWSNKILPFYQNGYNWAIEKVSSIVENGVYLAIKAFPAVISGAIKGATKFLTTDIFTIFGGLGRRDSDSIMSSLSAANSTPTSAPTINEKVQGLSSFNGASKFASSLIGSNVYDYYSGSSADQSTIADWYESGNSRSGYSANVVKPYQSNTGSSTNISDDPLTGYENGYEQNSGTLETNYDALMAYSESIASQGYSVPTASNNASYQVNNAIVEQNTQETGGLLSGIKNKVSGVKNKISNTVDNYVNRGIATTSTKVVDSSVPSSLVLNSTSVADRIAMEKQAKIDNKKYNKMSSSELAELGNTNTQVSYGKYNYYNTDSAINSGSSAGISLNGAQYDPNTGLVMSASGKFIPNAFYDPKTGMISSTPTKAAIKAYPNIQEMHDTIFQINLESGDITYEDLLGANYIAENDPYYREGDDKKVAGSLTMGNLRDSKDNIVEMLNNEDSLGRRFLGTSYNNGLNRVFLTGNTGIIGKGLNKLGTFGLNKKGPIGKLVGGTVRGTTGVANGLTNFAKNHSLAGLSTRMSYNNALLNQLKTQGAANAVDDVASGIRSAFPKIAKNTDSMSNASRKAWNKYVKNTVNSVADVGARANMKAAQGVVDVASSANGQKFLQITADAAEKSDGLIAKLSSKIKTCIANLIKSNEYRAAVSALAKEGLDADTIAKGLQEGSDDIVKAVERALTKTTQSGGKSVLKKVGAKIGRFLPFIGPALFITDFIKGFNDTPTYLGISSEQMDTLDFSPLLLRIVVGLAYALDNYFLLGLVPMETMVDLFVEILLPLFNVDTTSLAEARNETANQLEAFKVQSGNEDATVKDLNDSENWTTKLWNTLTGKKDKTKMSESEANSILESRKAAKNLDAVKHGNYSYNPNANSALYNNTSSVSSYMTDMRSNLNTTKTSDKKGKGSHLRLENEDPLEKMLPKYDKKYQNKRITPYTFNPAKAKYSTGKGSNISYADSPVYNMSWDNEPKKSYIGAGSGIINNFDTIIDMRSPMLKYNIDGAGSGNINHAYSSIGSIADLPQDNSALQRRYIGAGSGIKPVSSKATVHFYAGKATPTVQATGGSDIISESAKLIVKVETNGDIAHMEVDTNNCYSIGSACWNNSRAASLLKAIVKKGGSDSKKALGNDLYNQINRNTQFKNNTYSKASLSKIKKVLASQESRDVQSKQLASDIAGYINTIKKKFTDPKVIIFLTAYIHQYGDGGLNNLNIKGDSNISIDAFFKQFKELSPYKNYKSRYDTAYNVAANSTCTSANTNNTNYDAITTNLGVSEATVQNISDSEKNAKSNGSFTELFSSMSEAFKALFGFGSSNSAKAKQAAGKQDEYVEGVTSILGENVLPSEEVVDSIVGIALTREEIDDLGSKMNDVNFTLLERLNYLKQIYSSDPSVAVEYLANSTLLELLLYSRTVQTTLKISKYNGKYNQYYEAWDSPKYGRDGAKLEKLQEKINSVKQYVNPSNPNAHKIYFTDRNALKQDFELLDTHVELLVKDVEGLCNKVFKEFKELANNPYAMECAENLQTVMSGFRNAYAVSDVKAKKLEILKSVFKCNTSFYKELKKNFNNREVTVAFLDDYISSGKVISDYNEGLFLSAQDRLYRDLEVSFAALDKKDSTLEEKEVAWNSATGIMAELLGLDKSDVALTYDAVQNASNKSFVNERASELLAKTPDIDKDTLRNPNSNKDAINKFFNPPANVSDFKGLSKLASQTELKKNKTVLEDIKYINSKYPNVHDFDVLFGGKDIIDRFNTFNDTNTRGATSKIATFSGMPDSLRQFANIMNEKNRMYTPQELADNYYNIINSISADSYKSANVYNPYTFKRLMNMKNLLDVEKKSPYGPKYKEIMDKFVEEYIYNQDKSYTGNPDLLVASLFNNTTANKSISAQDVIDTNKEYGMEGFIDYYKAYLSDQSRVLNNYKYDRLGKDIKLIDSFLPNAEKNIKIEGKDVDYDNYVYAKALYEAYQNKINKMQEEDYKGRYLSKRNQKKFEKAFQEYLNFESRKAALLRQPYNEALKNYSADSNITFKELVPDTKSVDDYFSGMISNVPTQNTESYDAENADKGKEEVTDNKSVTIGTMLLAQSNGGSGSPEAMVDTMLDKYLKTKKQRKEARKNKKEREKENANKPKKVNGYIVDTEDQKAEKSTNINPDIPYDGSYESANNFWNGVKNLGKKISSWWKGDKEESKEGKGSDLTAKGNEFISQLDYANTKFSDGESLAEAGCGPAVAAMAINGLAGKASMMDTAKIADKYKTTGGTDATYFKDIFNRVGADTTYYEGNKASSESAKSLKAGQQVVLLGQDKSNKSKEKSPFGPGNHYVLAKGMANGKVAVNDPEQHGTKIYNKDILNKTKLGIAVSGKGSDKSYVGGASQFPTYALNEQQIRGAANIVAHEQSGTAARYAEASLMANLTDMDGNTKSVQDFVNKITGGWFRDGKNRFYNPPSNIEQSAINAVNDVIVKGYRTLPRYVDEHDCFTDIDYAKNNGTAINRSDRSSYIPNTTKVHNRYGSNYTFYSFPDSKSDPFGYTTTKGETARQKFGDAHFDINKNPVNGATVPTGDSVTGTITNTTVDSVAESEPQGFVAEMTQAFKDVAKSFTDQFDSTTETTSANTSMTTTSDGTFQPTGQFGEDVVNYARTFIGKLKYVWGGTSLTNGADCSGFCQQIYKKFGVNLPRTSKEQAAWSRGVKITDKSQLDKGDLVFFGNPVHHVGIYSGNNTYIHAPRTGEMVKESALSGRHDFNCGRRVSSLASSSSNTIAAGSNIVDKLNEMVAKGSEIKPSPSNKTLDKIERSTKAHQPIIKNKVVKAKPTTVKKRPTVQDAIDNNNYGKITKKKVVIGVDPDKQKSSYTGGASTLNTDQKAKLSKSKSNIIASKITPVKKSVETITQDNTLVINLLKTIVTLLADISANSQNSKDILKVLTKIYNLKSDNSNNKKAKTVEKTKKKKSGKGSELEDPVVDTSYNNPNVIIPQIASTTQSVMNNHSNSDYDDINSLIQDLVKVLS